MKGFPISEKQGVGSSILPLATFLLLNYNKIMNTLYKRIKSYLIRIDEPKINKTKFPTKIILYLSFKCLNLIRWFLAFRYINKVNSLEEFYNKIQIFWYRGNEGHTQQSTGQTSFLKNISKNCSYVFEIGFNGGHSSETILRNNPNSKVFSCDIGWHFYTKFGKWYLQKKYGDRLVLFIGDSKKIIPDLELENQKFDLIFIDGGHEYEDALNDIVNCKKFADENTLLLLDDVLFNNKEDTYHANSGPTQAWKQLIKEKFISQMEYEEFRGDNLFRSFITGKYEF